MFFFSGKRVKPFKQGVAQYKVLLKEEHTIYGPSYNSSYKTYTTYKEVMTDGFFYEKDCKKYYNIIDGDKSYFAEEAGLVFLEESI